jgi:hypothetical protein
MKRSLFLSLSLTALACSAASSAMAQGNFERDRNMSVRERPRPDYQARGLPLGAFTAYPKLTAGVESNDHIYASRTNERDDTIYSVQPELIIQSGWSRNALQAFVRGGRRMYADAPKESTTDYQLGVSGYVDAGNSRILAGGDYGEYTEPRTSGTTPTTAAKPVEYTLGQANIGLIHTFNRMRISGRVDLQDYDYKNARTPAGAFLLQDDRDRQVMTYSARGEYALSPDTALFIVAAYDDREYDLQPPRVGFNRDSQGLDIAAGLNFDLTALVRGEFQIGYIDQDYVSPRLKDVKGLSAKGLVEWFPTSLDTVTFAASRGVSDATIGGASGFLAGNYSVQLDHELMRNVILTGRAGIGKDEYEGVDRTDDRVTAYLGANYLLNRGVGFTLSYDYLKQDSSGAARGPIFEANKITLSSTLQF